MASESLLLGFDWMQVRESPDVAPFGAIASDGGGLGLDVTKLLRKPVGDRWRSYMTQGLARVTLSLAGRPSWLTANPAHGLFPVHSSLWPGDEQRAILWSTGDAADEELVPTSSSGSTFDAGDHTDVDEGASAFDPETFLDASTSAESTIVLEFATPSSVAGTAGDDLHECVVAYQRSPGTSGSPTVDIEVKDGASTVLASLTGLVADDQLRWATVVFGASNFTPADLRVEVTSTNQGGSGGDVKNVTLHLWPDNRTIQHNTGWETIGKRAVPTGFTGVNPWLFGRRRIHTHPLYFRSAGEHTSIDALYARVQWRTAAAGSASRAPTHFELGRLGWVISALRVDLPNQSVIDWEDLSVRGASRATADGTEYPIVNSSVRRLRPAELGTFTLEEGAALVGDLLQAFLETEEMGFSVWPNHAADVLPATSFWGYLVGTLPLQHAFVDSWRGAISAREAPVGRAGKVSS